MLLYIRKRFGEIGSIGSARDKRPEDRQDIFTVLFAIGAKIAYDREKDFFGRGVR